MSGYIGDLSPKQELALSSFKSRFEDSDTVEQLSLQLPPDNEILRFLRANKFKTVKALDAYLTYVKWRISFKVDEITPQDFLPELEKEVFFKAGELSSGVPCIVARLGRHDPKTRDLDAFVKMIVYLMEGGIKRMKPGIEGFFIIFDYTGWNLSKMDTSLDKALTDLLQKMYPERLYKACIINPPRVFSMAFRIIKPLLNERTQSKIEVLGSNFKEKLLEFFTIDQLPVLYGGNNSCSFDDFYKDLVSSREIPYDENDPRLVGWTPTFKQEEPIATSSAEDSPSSAIATSISETAIDYQKDNSKEARASSLLPPPHTITTPVPLDIPTLKDIRKVINKAAQLRIVEPLELSVQQYNKNIFKTQIGFSIAILLLLVFILFTRSSFSSQLKESHSSLLHSQYAISDQLFLWKSSKDNPLNENQLADNFLDYLNQHHALFEYHSTAQLDQFIQAWNEKLRDLTLDIDKLDKSLKRLVDDKNTIKMVLDKSQAIISHTSILVDNLEKLATLQSSLGLNPIIPTFQSSESTTKALIFNQAFSDFRHFLGSAIHSIAIVFFSVFTVYLIVPNKVPMDLLWSKDFFKNLLALIQPEIYLQKANSFQAVYQYLVHFIHSTNQLFHAYADSNPQACTLILYFVEHIIDICFLQESLELMEPFCNILIKFSSVIRTGKSRSKAPDDLDHNFDQSLVSTLNQHKLFLRLVVKAVGHSQTMNHYSLENSDPVRLQLASFLSIPTTTDNVSFDSPWHSAKSILLGSTPVYSFKTLSIVSKSIDLSRLSLWFLYYSQKASSITVPQLSQTFQNYGQHPIYSLKSISLAKIYPILATNQPDFKTTHGYLPFFYEVLTPILSKTFSLFHPVQGIRFNYFDMLIHAGIKFNPGKSFTDYLAKFLSSIQDTFDPEDLSTLFPLVRYFHLVTISNQFSIDIEPIHHNAFCHKILKHFSSVALGDLTFIEIGIIRQCIGSISVISEADLLDMVLNHIINERIFACQKHFDYFKAFAQKKWPSIQLSKEYSFSPQLVFNSGIRKVFTKHLNRLTLTALIGFNDSILKFFSKYLLDLIPFDVSPDDELFSDFTFWKSIISGGIFSKFNILNYPISQNSTLPNMRFKSTPRGILLDSFDGFDPFKNQQMNNFQSSQLLSISETPIVVPKPIVTTIQTDNEIFLFQFFKNSNKYPLMALSLFQQRPVLLLKICSQCLFSPKTSKFLLSQCIYTLSRLFGLLGYWELSRKSMSDWVNNYKTFAEHRSLYISSSNTLFPIVKNFSALYPEIEPNSCSQFTKNQLQNILCLFEIGTVFFGHHEFSKYSIRHLHTILSFFSLLSEITQHYQKFRDHINSLLNQQNLDLERLQFIDKYWNHNQVFQDAPNDYYSKQVQSVVQKHFSLFNAKKLLSQSSKYGQQINLLAAKGLIKQIVTVDPNSNVTFVGLSSSIQLFINLHTFSDSAEIRPVKTLESTFEIRQLEFNPFGPLCLSVNGYTQSEILFFDHRLHPIKQIHIPLSVGSGSIINSQWIDSQTLLITTTDTAYIIDTNQSLETKIISHSFQLMTGTFLTSTILTVHNNKMIFAIGDTGHVFLQSLGTAEIGAKLLTTFVSTFVIPPNVSFAHSYFHELTGTLFVSLPPGIQYATISSKEVSQLHFSQFSAESFPVVNGVSTSPKTDSKTPPIKGSFAPCIIKPVPFFPQLVNIFEPYSCRHFLYRLKNHSKNDSISHLQDLQHIKPLIEINLRIKASSTIYPIGFSYSFSILDLLTRTNRKLQPLHQFDLLHQQQLSSQDLASYLVVTRFLTFFLYAYYTKPHQPPLGPLLFSDDSMLTRKSLSEYLRLFESHTANFHSINFPYPSIPPVSDLDLEIFLRGNTHCVTALNNGTGYISSLECVAKSCQSGASSTQKIDQKIHYSLIKDTVLFDNPSNHDPHSILIDNMTNYFMPNPDDLCSIEIENLASFTSLEKDHPSFTKPFQPNKSHSSTLISWSHPYSSKKPLFISVSPIDYAFFIFQAVHMASLLDSRRFPIKKLYSTLEYINNPLSLRILGSFGGHSANLPNESNLSKIDSFPIMVSNRKDTLVFRFFNENARVYLVDSIRFYIDYPSSGAPSWIQVGSEKQMTPNSGWYEFQITHNPLAQRHGILVQTSSVTSGLPTIRQIEVFFFQRSSILYSSNRPYEHILSATFGVFSRFLPTIPEPTLNPSSSLYDSSVHHRANRFLNEKRAAESELLSLRKNSIPIVPTHHSWLSDYDLFQSVHYNHLYEQFCKSIASMLNSSFYSSPLVHSSAPQDVEQTFNSFLDSPPTIFSDTPLERRTYILCSMLLSDPTVVHPSPEKLIDYISQFSYSKQDHLYYSLSVHIQVLLNNIASLLLHKRPTFRSLTMIIGQLFRLVPALQHVGSRYKPTQLFPQLLDLSTLVHLLPQLPHLPHDLVFRIMSFVLFANPIQSSKFLTPPLDFIPSRSFSAPLIRKFANLGFNFMIQKPSKKQSFSPGTSRSDCLANLIDYAAKPVSSSFHISLPSQSAETQWFESGAIFRLPGNLRVHSMKLMFLSPSSGSNYLSPTRVTIAYINLAHVDFNYLKHHPEQFIQVSTMDITYSEETWITLNLRNRFHATHLLLFFDDFKVDWSAKSESSLRCPSCNRTIFDPNGHCPSDGENAFQCLKCRNINYHNLDSYFCIECGTSRHANIELRLCVSDLPQFLPHESSTHLDETLKTLKRICSMLDQEISPEDPVFISQSFELLLLKQNLMQISNPKTVEIPDDDSSCPDCLAQTVPSRSIMRQPSKDIASLPILTKILDHSSELSVDLLLDLF